MCGVSGIKAKLENRDFTLQRMLDSMWSRGPDNAGTYFDSDIALGCRRLKIIDLTSQGNQPMSGETNDIWIVHNGEIYNFKELRRQLEDLGHRFKSYTDTEVILHSYEEWGRDCLSKLRGMFAFGIWDKRKKELFLARDRLGIKPLYYYFKNGVFIFASCVRAILATGLLPKRLNLGGLLTYLDFGGLKEPLTIIEGVYSLLPAHYLILNEKEFKIINYWCPLKKSIPNPHFTQGEIIARLKLLLKETTQLHLISDVPLGVFLSGGIDSSSLLSLASQISPRIKSISLVFRQERFNEANYSRLVAKRFDTEHQEVFIEEDFLLKNISGAIDAMDEPTFNGINTYFISKIAKEVGLTVALSGLGGDELFCGYSNFRRINRLIWFCKIWQKSPGLLRDVFTGVLERIVPAVRQKNKLMELVKDNLNHQHPYFWMRRLFSEEQKQHLLEKQFVPREDKIDGLLDLDPINQISYLEMSNYMRDILLRDTDFMSMAHSLEVRVPFLDHKLVEFILSIPGKFKMDNHLPKPLLVKSLDEPLPKTIIRRKKMGFVFPFEIWLRQNLKTEMEETLRGKLGILDEFLNQKAILEIWQGFLKRRISWQRPWAVYVLKKWVKTYLESTTL